MIYKDSNFNNVFWKFSLEFYDRPKVASRLISLQDDLGVNVNLVLCCFWSADRGFSVLTRQVISDLNAIVEDWNLLVVKPLRSVRLEIKHLESDKYKKIREKIRSKTKDLELSTEQFEQMIIYDYLNTNTGSSTLSEQDKMEIAKSNLFSYLGFLKLDTRVDSEMLDELLDSFRKFLQKSIQ